MLICRCFLLVFRLINFQLHMPTLIESIWYRIWKSKGPLPTKEFLYYNYYSMLTFPFKSIITSQVKLINILNYHKPKMKKKITWSPALKSLEQLKYLYPNIEYNNICSPLIGQTWTSQALYISKDRNKAKMVCLCVLFYNAYNYALTFEYFHQIFMTFANSNIWRPVWKHSDITQLYLSILCHMKWQTWVCRSKNYKLQYRVMTREGKKDSRTCMVIILTNYFYVIVI